MNKIFITLLTLVMLAITTSSFANGTEISKNVSAAFSAVFVKATDISWDRTGSFFKASFRMNGQSLSAFLSEDGQVVAVSRNILSTELPVYLQLVLNKNFPKYWISDLFEYTAGGETKYYVTVENADEKLILESAGTYDWSLFKKMAK